MRCSTWWLIAAIWLAGCRAPKPPKEVSGYVDSAVCAGCHREIAETFRQTGMGRSIDKTNALNSVTGRLSHKASDRDYSIVERNGSIYQRRHQIGFDGRETNVVEKQAEFVIGSGNHARTYLTRNQQGKLVEMPLSWYAERGGYWAMSPGYDQPHHEDFRRVVPDECLFCHASYPDPVASEPRAIDCQRCHGPGRAHAEAAAKGNKADIVNPKRLSRDRQMDLCMQCHLETTSSPLPNAIRRYEHAALSYRTGEPLTKFQIYFDPRDDRFEIAHAAYRLRKSRCYIQSQMTCGSCHDPHRARRGAEAQAFYAAACRQCHAKAHAAEAAKTNCTSCHMPQRRTMDAVHVVMTDHYIQRRKPDGDLLAPIAEEQRSYRGEVALYYPERVSDDIALYVAVAQVQHGSNLAAGIPRLQSLIEKQSPERSEFYFELGKAFSKAGNNIDAVHWYEAALRRDKSSLQVLKGLAISLIALNQFDRAVSTLEQAPAPDPVVLANLGNALLKKGNVARAANVLKQSLAMNADTPEAANLLGIALLKTGDRAGAERQFREAIRIQPDLAEAHNNLASLFTEMKDYAQARFHFERAIALNPAYAEAHHSYGFLLILMGSHAQAQSHFERAVSLDPSLVQARVDLADMLVVGGRPDRAEELYREAIRQKPEFAEAHYGLGKLLVPRGKIAEAAEQFEQAVRTNPEYHEAHLALGIMLNRSGKADVARIHFQKAAESQDAALRQLALKALR